MSDKFGSRYETAYTKFPTKVAALLGLKNRWRVLEANFLIFGLGPFLIFIYGFFSSFDLRALGLPLTVNILIASLWILIGPLLTTGWELRLRLLAISIRKRQGLERRKNGPTNTVLDHYKCWSKWWGATFVVISLSYFFMVKDSLTPFTTLYTDPVMLSITTLNLSIVSFVCGYGCCGVVQALLVFLRLPSLGIEWTAFHGDGRGGLGFLVSFALATTFSFAGGVVVLPAVLNIGQRSGSAGYFGFMLVGLYTALLFSIFAFAMLRVYQLERFSH